MTRPPPRARSSCVIAPRPRAARDLRRQLLQEPPAEGAGRARPRRHGGEAALDLLRAAARDGERLQHLLPRRQGAGRDDARARRLAPRRAGRPPGRLDPRRERRRPEGTADRRAVDQPQRDDGDAARRRLPAGLLDPDRLRVAHLPDGRSLDQPARPVARPRGVHPLPERPAAGLRGHPQREPGVAGPGQRHADRADRLRLHGDDQAREGGHRASTCTRRSCSTRSSARSSRTSAGRTWPRWSR